MSMYLRVCDLVSEAKLPYFISQIRTEGLYRKLSNVMKAAQ
jgi:hypothetical protein